MGALSIPGLTYDAGGFESAAPFSSLSPLRRNRLDQLSGLGGSPSAPDTSVYSNNSSYSGMGGDVSSDDQTDAQTQLLAQNRLPRLRLRDAITNPATRQANPALYGSRVAKAPGIANSDMGSVESMQPDSQVSALPSQVSALPDSSDLPSNDAYGQFSSPTTSGHPSQDFSNSPSHGQLITNGSWGAGAASTTNHDASGGPLTSRVLDYIQNPQNYGAFPDKDPSVWRRIVGGLARMNPISAQFADDITYGTKSAQAMHRYARMLPVLMQAAQLEQHQQQLNQTDQYHQLLLGQHAQNQQSLDDARAGRIAVQQTQARENAEKFVGQQGAEPLPTAIDIPPSENYAPAQLPTASNLPLSQTNSTNQLPERVVSPGLGATSQSLVPRGYRQMTLPAAPGVPSEQLMAPPANVLAQQRAESAAAAQGKDLIDTPAELQDLLGPKATRDQISRANKASLGKKDANYWVAAATDPNSPPEVVARAKQALSLLAEQAKAGRAQTGVNLTPETVQGLAQYYGTTGELPPLGMGAAAAGQRAQILNRVFAGGNTPNIASSKADYRSNASALTALQRQASQTQAFERTATSNLDIAQDLSDKVGRSGSPILNRWILAAKGRVAGDEDTQAFEAAVQTAVNEYAKVVTNNGATGSVTDSARREYDRILSSATNPTAFKQVVGVLKQEMNNRIQGFSAEIGSRRQAIGNRGQLPTTPQSGGATGGTVRMRAPNGQTRDVPSDQVEHFKSLGAVVVQ